MSEIPEQIKEALDDAALRYSKSKATTNIGAFGRFIAKFISPSFIIKLFAHKLTN
jgi:hypothetical protein